MAHTIESLRRDLRLLGISEGDVLFVHSSFKSLGPVDGGAETVVAALMDVVGLSGLLLMPSFNLLGDRGARADAWDIETTPSTVGWLTEFFRQMPGTYRSDHYSHSVAARGQDAEAFVTGHLDLVGMQSPWDLAPWGKAYGTHSPMMRAYERDGKVLMLGVDYRSSTYAHVVEVMYWNGLLRWDKRAEYVWLERSRTGPFWDRVGHMRRDKVGNADCRCFGIQDYVDTLLAEVKEDPDVYDRVKLQKLDAQ